jgi:hypothetical protein
MWLRSRRANTHILLFSEVSWVKLTANHRDNSETCPNLGQHHHVPGRVRHCTLPLSGSPQGRYVVNRKETGAAYDGSDDLCGRGSAGRRPMSGRFCRSGVGRPCFPGSARVSPCLAGCVDEVPERSELNYELAKRTREIIDNR